LKVDLHDIFSSGDKIERAIDDLFEDAIRYKKKMIEIIPGKGSGQLKKSVLRYIEKKYKGQYARIEKDDKNWGRIFVHFRWK
jgi:dsDNA-specific endonuclease/ATPase MutS2